MFSKINYLIIIISAHADGGPRFPCLWCTLDTVARPIIEISGFSEHASATPTPTFFVEI